MAATLRSALSEAERGPDGQRDGDGLRPALGDDGDAATRTVTAIPPATTPATFFSMTSDVERSQGDW